MVMSQWASRPCRHTASARARESRLETRGHFSPTRTVWLWGRLPRMVVPSPCLEGFKPQVDKALSTWPDPRADPALGRS